VPAFSRSWSIYEVAVLALVACVCATIAPHANANIVALPGPISSDAPDLPAGRVYEQVSPPNKHATRAGAVVGLSGSYGTPGPALATSDGNALYYLGPTQLETAVSGLEGTQIAQRYSSGWQRRPAISAPVEIESPFDALPDINEPSADLSHVLFSARGAFVTSGDVIGGSNMFLAGQNPLEQPVWIGRPTTGHPLPEMGAVVVREMQTAGGSRNFDRVYFAYYGSLTEADAPREPYIPQSTFSNMGFYEWSQTGGLKSAGVLPDGTVSPFGAVPAGELQRHLLVRPALFNNEVSTDGSRAFFVSPDPGAELATLCNANTSGSGGCVPQLYVRETNANGGQSTVLVSQDDLLPPESGLPAKAPDGVLPVIQPTALTEEPNGHPGDTTNNEVTDAYASSDGTHVLFESEDQLTSDAPAGSAPKEYAFDTTTNTLRYLPGVTDGTGGNAAVVAASATGSRFLFARMTGRAVTELDIWTDGPGGGTVAEVAQLPTVASGPESTHVNSGRVSSDGTVFVFQTNSPLSGGFNNQPVGRPEGTEEIYRYVTQNDTLSCVSCPPEGVTPSGSARLSGREIEAVAPELIHNHAISADARTIFFDTPDPLVARDVNAARDVYEWHDGTVSLISSGSGPIDSVVLDNGEDGRDVFFATTDGLAPEDTDGEYDVYDARVPHPGDAVATIAEPCQPAVCEESANSTSSLFGAPVTASLAGPGNVSPTSVAKHVPKKPKKRKGHRRKRHRRKANARAMTLRATAGRSATRIEGSK
jgi:hypothetical protein